MTPPNVLPAPKPVSSVMMRRMFGAPLGGTTRGGHHGVDCSALRSILPPKGGAGGGSCFPSIVVVASGEPSTPVTCWAVAGRAGTRSNTTDATAPTPRRNQLIGLFLSLSESRQQRLNESPHDENILPFRAIAPAWRRGQTSLDPSPDLDNERSILDASRSLDLDAAHERSDRRTTAKARRR